MRAKFLEDLVEVSFKGFSIAGFKGHPLILDFAPQDFDAVELWTVGRQKVQGQSLLLEQVRHGLDRFCHVYRGVVQHDCQGFAHMLKQQPPKVRKQFSRGVVPEFGAEQSTRAEHGFDDVEPLTPHRCRGVAFTRRCPSISVGLGLRESSFIEKGQGQLSSLGLCLEFFKNQAFLCFCRRSFSTIELLNSIVSENAMSSASETFISVAILVVADITMRFTLWAVVN